MIRAIAIDDEPIALEVIRSHAAKVPFLQVDAYFSDAFKAIEFMATQPVDVMFLDIKMPDMSGIELLAGLRTRPLVIFTTAYPDHAAESYELDAVDYLLKPFSLPRFLKACHKANDLLGARRRPSPEESVFIKSGYEQIRVHFHEILYVESAGNYMSFVLENEKRILSRLTMQEVLSLLPAGRFLRVHRSYVVNREKVTKAERHQLHIGLGTVPVSAGFALDELT